VSNSGTTPEFKIKPSTLQKPHIAGLGRPLMHNEADHVRPRRYLLVVQIEDITAFEFFSKNGAGDSRHVTSNKPHFNKLLNTLRKARQLKTGESTELDISERKYNTKPIGMSE
jgi:hypothetical protein